MMIISWMVSGSFSPTRYPRSREHYSLFDFRRDVEQVIVEIRCAQKTHPVWRHRAYLESVLKSWPLQEVPEDPEFKLPARESDENLSMS
jgi:hypothetical protein